MHERLQQGLLRRLHEAAEEQRELRVAHLPRAHAERVRRLAACRRHGSSSSQRNDPTAGRHQTFDRGLCDNPCMAPCMLRSPYRQATQRQAESVSLAHCHPHKASGWLQGVGHRATWRDTVPTLASSATDTDHKVMAGPPRWSGLALHNEMNSAPTPQDSHAML